VAASPSGDSQKPIAAQQCRVLLEHIGLAVFVFYSARLGYANAAARRLLARVRRRYDVELLVTLRDHLRTLDARSIKRTVPIVSVITAPDGEPFHLEVVPLGRGVVALSIREVGADLDSLSRQFKLTPRETQVAGQAVHGRRNAEIARSLGITIETTKRHLRRVYTKVGVRTRVQLAHRLG
jgi:DNA-binding CsgD family transcriptional regulator